jgi:cysteine synthase A
MLAYGCQVEVVDGEPGAGQDEAGDGQDRSLHGGRTELYARMACRDLEKRDPEVWWARQFANSCNVGAHRESTGAEILEQTDGRLDAFVASVGTGGTLLGVAQALKAHDPEILIVGVEPLGSSLLDSPEGAAIIPGISDGILQDLVESQLVDRKMSIANDMAVEMAHQLAQREGIFAGMSSGANVAACLQLAEDLGPGKRIVTVLPDSRDRYLEVELYTT